MLYVLSCILCSNMANPSSILKFRLCVHLLFIIKDNSFQKVVTLLHVKRRWCMSVWFHCEIYRTGIGVCSGLNLPTALF